MRHAICPSMEPHPIAFARIAARCGWRAEVLSRFGARRGLSDEVRRQLWPKGVRSVAWELNALADAATRAAFRGNPAARTSAIIVARFDQNRPLKRAVRRLARSDLFHPVDTLKRTAVTAELMWECRAGRTPLTSWRRARLVAAYCLVVLLWLADPSLEARLTKRATPFVTSLFRVD